MKKLKVAVIFGGRSAEHEVSLQSAKNIISTLDKEKYQPILIGIDKQGRWLKTDSANFLLNETNPKLISLNASSKEVALLSGHQNHQLIESGKNLQAQSIDVVFVSLHGPFGEDGTIQGLLKLANLPFVGASVLGSAIGMDKDVMKRLLKAADIPVAKFIVVHRNDVILNEVKDIYSSEPEAHQNDKLFDMVKNQLGLPVFIKPANLGSSVGVSKASSKKDFNKAIKKAFLYDNKILIEEAIKAREIEVSVLGNEKPIASVAGEIIPSHEFYSYEAKYIDELGAKLEIPAKISSQTLKRVQNLAIKTFQALCCEGMARVDCFLKENGQVLINEINTIPGFTKISMYPKLWEASGISYSELIDRLIQLALERHQRDQKLKTSFEVK
ncbi:D-alanine--D-alanine ligase [Candidatus Daviesbacteria bacterium]|nr:D-alanine--D-alanine ligase [Candidatus Daviesbacteria bacterium]